MLRIAAFLSLALALCTSEFASATELLSGERRIYLLDKTGESIVIGRIDFTPQENGEVSYQLHLDHSEFQDYFLSMKEMKCLSGPELMCSIPYPYEQPRKVSVRDLRWLEHDLLFMYKKPDAFGANLWNGIYYRLALADGQIRGVAHSIDLNILASPGDDLKLPPVTEHDIDEADLQRRWLPYIEIR